LLLFRLIGHGSGDILRIGSQSKSKIASQRILQEGTKVSNGSLYALVYKHSQFNRPNALRWC